VPYDRPMSETRTPMPTTRSATRSDVAGLTALIAACEMALDGTAEVSPMDVENSLGRAATEDDVIVAEADGQLVGWATVLGDRATVDVHPAWWDTGLGSSLRSWTEAQARASGQRRVKQIVSDADDRARRSFEAAGYQRGSAAWILVTDMGDEPPTVVIPPGVSIRPYDPDLAGSVYRVIEDAFNEWPDRQPIDLETWAAAVTGHPAFAPHLSRLAFVGDELVGAAMSDEYEGDEGWVQQIATKTAFRHRGIARALLQSVFAAFHATGRRRVGLSTNSQTGALSLYEHIGMRVRRSYTTWVKDLDQTRV